MESTVQYHDVNYNVMPYPLYPCETDAHRSSLVKNMYRVCAKVTSDWNGSELRSGPVQTLTSIVCFFDKLWKGINLHHIS